MLAKVRALVEARRRRRYNCDRQDDASWDERAEAAAALVATNVVDGSPLTVADLGCGNGRLQRVLDRHLNVPPDYQGYDLHPQHPSVRRLDVATEALPSADVTFVLGVVEYLRDPASFVARLRRVTGWAVISYSIADSPEPLSPSERRTRGWQHDHARQSFTDLLTGAGMTVVATDVVSRGRTVLWLCRPAPGDGA